MNVYDKNNLFVIFRQMIETYLSDHGQKKLVF